MKNHSQYASTTATNADTIANIDSTIENHNGHSNSSSNQYVSMKKFSPPLLSATTRPFDPHGDNANSIGKKQINCKLLANQITNDIIKPKAISASEAKIKNNLNSKIYESISSSSGGGYKMRDARAGICLPRGEAAAATATASDYSISIIRGVGPSRSIDYLSCTSTNSSDSSSIVNNCDYLHSNNGLASSSGGSQRSKIVVNDYVTSDYAISHQHQRPKSSQSQHNPYKSPSEKKSYHRKHYSPQHHNTHHSASNSASYTKKSHHPHNATKKSHSQQHQHTHKHQSHTRTTNTNNINNNSHISTDNSSPSSPPPPPSKPRSLEHSTAKQRYS